MEEGTGVGLLTDEGRDETTLTDLVSNVPDSVYNRDNIVHRIEKEPEPSKNCCVNLINKYPRLCLGLWIFLGVILVFLATQMFWIPQFMQATVHKGIRDTLIFTEVDESNSNYNTWATGGDVPIWLEVRFFNVTNVKEVLTHGAPPKLQIVGPLVYVDNIVRHNVSFSEDKQWATYQYWEYYTLDTERQSYIKPTDMITIVAPWTGTLHHWYYESHKYEKEVLEDIFTGLSDKNPYPIAFLTDTAENILFQLMNKTFNGTNNTITIAPAGFVTNYTIDGTNSDTIAPWETTHTGYQAHERMGEVKTWQGSEYQMCWDPPQQISGSHDDYFGLFSVSKGGMINVWVYDINRALYMQNNRTFYWKDILVYEYYLQRSQFDSIKIDPANAQFYQNTTGLVNLTKCKGGVPTFMSLALFIGAPDYLEMLPDLGLRDPTIDDNTYIYVEPMTGAIFKANKSLQINFPIRPLPVKMTNDSEYGNASLANLPSYMVPTVLLSQCTELPQHDIDKFKQAYVAQEIGHASPIVGGVCWGLLAIWAYYSFYRWGKKDRKPAPIIN